VKIEESLMKLLRIAASLAVSLAALFAGTTLVHAACVGVSLDSGQAGFHDQIDIGVLARPPLIEPHGRSDRDGYR
jgi:hypothetical protein